MVSFIAAPPKVPPELQYDLVQIMSPASAEVGEHYRPQIGLVIPAGSNGDSLEVLLLSIPMTGCRIRIKPEAVRWDIKCSTEYIPPAPEAELPCGVCLQGMDDPRIDCSLNILQPCCGHFVCIQCEPHLSTCPYCRTNLSSPGDKFTSCWNRVLKKGDPHAAFWAWSYLMSMGNSNINWQCVAATYGDKLLAIAAALGHRVAIYQHAFRNLDRQLELCRRPKASTHHIQIAALALLETSAVLSILINDPATPAITIDHARAFLAQLTGVINNSTTALGPSSLAIGKKGLVDDSPQWPLSSH